MLGLFEALVGRTLEQGNRLLGDLAALEFAQCERVEGLGMLLLECTLIPLFGGLLVLRVAILPRFQIPRQMVLRFTPTVFSCDLKPVVRSFNVQRQQIAKSVVL